MSPTQRKACVVLALCALAIVLEHCGRLGTARQLAF